MNKRFITEFFSMACVVAFAITISNLKLDGTFSLNLEKNTFFYAVLTLISVFTYSFFRCFLPAFASLAFSIFSWSGLYFASMYKAKLATFPLSYNDIVSVTNISISAKFLSMKEFLGILILIIMLVSFAVYNIIKNKKYIYRRAIISASFLSFVFLMHSTYKQEIVSLLHDNGVQYHNWNPVVNFNDNGLLIHLLQTSARTIPPHPNSKQEALYSSKEILPNIEKSPKNVIMILCESCWNNEDNFQANFQPLYDLQPLSLRAVSPVVGGGTPNTTFEMISGLPVKHPSIFGVFYQEYEELVSNTPDTIPFLLTKNGVKTYSLHNFNKNMYKRSLVEPKLGFNEFIGLDGMENDLPSEYFPRDRVLFRAAKKVIEEQHTSRLFLHLATVHLHGPFTSYKDDDGYAHYGRKLSDTVKDTAEFVEFLMVSDDDNVVIVYGDHTPPLWTFFKDAPPSVREDVPVLIFDRNTQRRESFGQAAANKPFYCYASVISEVYYGFQLPAQQFTRKACEESDPALGSGLITKT